MMAIVACFLRRLMREILLYAPLEERTTHMKRLSV
jgi:hypothetical protein